MCTVSFDKKALNVTIHNQHPNLELISPVYCSKNATCHISPNQQTDNDNIMEASFGIVSKQKSVKGALLYKLQRKCTTETDNQLDNSIVLIENTTTNMYLLVIWDVKDGYHGFRVCLIEFTDDLPWDEDMLWTLRHRYKRQFLENYKPTIITWLVHGDIVMKTRRDITFESDYKLNIGISERNRGYNMLKPMKIDPKRLVSLL
jgi:hypothetical protein